jgi:hypothetical protein
MKAFLAAGSFFVPSRTLSSVMATPSLKCAAGDAILDETVIALKDLYPVRRTAKAAFKHTLSLLSAQLRRVCDSGDLRWCAEILRQAEIQLL